jgi:CubicO group peptidase (beta-lactamase class C family)
MVWLKRIFIALAVIIVLLIIGLKISGNGHILTGITKTYLIGKSKPDIDDLSGSCVRIIPADRPEPWPLSKRYGLDQIPAEYVQQVDSFETTALLVFRDDSLLYERYWDDYSDTTHSNSFSMAKSFTAMCIGKAIDDGYIKSVDQPVGDFIPEFKEGKAASLTIKHLLQMVSGIPFGESYSSPFGYMARAYYGDDLLGETMKYTVQQEPGTLWSYEGGNTVLLGEIIKRATGRTASDYFFQKFWSCIGAEHKAYWSIDHEGGIERTFSGFYATARDFARIGKLYEHQGVWGNDTLLSPEYVRASLTPCEVPDSKGENTFWYGYQWWLGTHENVPFFSCRGMRGQYIIVVPEQHLIVVRLGHNQSKERENHMPPDMLMYLKIAKEIAN